MTEWAKLNRSVDAGARRRQTREVLIYNRDDLNRALTECYKQPEKISVLKLAADIILESNINITSGISIIIDGGGVYGFKGDYQITTAADIHFANLNNYRIGIAATGLPLFIENCKFESGGTDVTAYPAIKVSGTYIANADNDIKISDVTINAYTTPVNINGTGMSNVNGDIDGIHIYGTSGTYTCDIDFTGRINGIINTNNAGLYDVRMNLRGSHCMYLENNINLLYVYGGYNSIIANNWSGGLSTAVLDTTVGSGYNILGGNTDIDDTSKTLTEFCKDLDSADSMVTVRVKNSDPALAGATINKGTIVYISGSNGVNPYINISTNATEVGSSRTLGFLAGTLTNNQFGYVINQGIIKNVNTSGLADGVSLYLSTAGGYTSTKPVAPAHEVRVGTVLKGGSAGGGIIFIRVQNGYELDELHDVSITTAAKGDIIVRNGSSLWQNLPVGTDTFVLTADSTTATGIKWAAGGGGGGGSPSIGGTITGGTAGSILFVDPAATIAQDNANLYFDNANNRLGLGTTSPAQKLHVSGGTILVDGGGDLQIRPTSPGGNGIIKFVDTAGTVRSNLYFAGTDLLRISDLTADRVVLSSAGRVGIGTASPGSILHAKSSGELTRFESTAIRGSGNNYITWYDPTGRKGYLGYGSGTTDDFYINNDLAAAKMHLATVGTIGLTLDASQKVGIGTTAPSQKLEVAGTAYVNSGGNLRIRPSSSIADGNIMFENVASPGTMDAFLYTDGTNSLTVADTNGAPRYTLTQTGNTIIGDASVTPDSTLHVYKASAGAVTSNASTVLTVESNSTAYISVLSPVANEGGIIFGSPSSSTRGGVNYNHPTDRIDLRTTGNITQLNANTGGVAIGIATNTSESRLELGGTKPYITLGTTTAASVTTPSAGKGAYWADSAAKSPYYTNETGHAFNLVDTGGSSLMFPPAFYAAATTGTRVITAGGQVLAIYIGKCPEYMKTGDIVNLTFIVATIAATVTWAEVAVAKGTFTQTTNPTLTYVGSVSVAADIITTGTKTKAVTIGTGVAVGPANNTFVLPGEDLWFVIGNQATTGVTIRAANVANPLVPAISANLTTTVRPSLATTTVTPTNDTTGLCPWVSLQH